ncbi:MAG: TrmH family RNA methyltransferase [Bacteroidota bacterium]|jgi:23S rRNA (guanosine2251-2'-O)-methyltransferase
MTKIIYSIIVENTRSAQNIGAIFRSADAFACDRIILTGISATPPHKDILKTALGATLSVNWQYLDNIKDAIELLRTDGYRIIALEQTPGATLLQDVNFGNYPKQAFIVGNEVEGVSPETMSLCDQVIEIPQAGVKKSINVAIAASILMWSCFKHNLSSSE